MMIKEKKKILNNDKIYIVDVASTLLVAPFLCPSIPDLYKLKNNLVTNQVDS